MTKPKIQVFKSEIEDGISDQVKASASIAYVTQLWDTAVSQEAAREVMKALAGTSIADDEQFDLFYLNTILVTTGWNKNFDVFPKIETFKARYTPIHKQFNLEHDQSKIIGHMTSSQVVDVEYKAIADDISTDLLPDKFHILTGAVIYRALSDPDSQAKIEELISEIEAGQWYVSMECLFRGFDYAVIKPDGTKSFIERNEESSFLTKHLRQYGGSGKYKDYTLGRALKNITFSGKGLVRKPANPESIIFNQAVADFNEKYESLVYIFNNDENKISKHDTETFVMADNAEQKDLEKKITELADANKALTETNKSLAEQVKTFESSQTTAKITSLENAIVAKDEKIVSLEASLDEVKKQHQTLAGDNGELLTRAQNAEKRVSELETEITSIRAAEKTRARFAMLTDLKASEEQAKELVKLLSDKSDEEFKTLANMLVKPVENKEVSVDTSTVIEAAETDSKDDATLTVTAGQVDANVEAQRVALYAYLQNDYTQNTAKKGR
jgi:hypothetical protein